MKIERFPARLQANTGLDRSQAYGPAERAVLSQAALARARTEITSWPGYAPTPLVALPGLARGLGLGAIHYKDESKRFGLMSFKALGGAYAVLLLLEEHLAANGIAGATAADLLAHRHAERVRDVTVVSATDGNHGRSVAWGAQMFGCRCIIYLHEHVSRTREKEIARYGAEIRRVSGSYDDSVRRCAADAKAEGWVLVADTSLDGDARVPSMVMQGYALLVEEIAAQAGATRPTHVFVPGAVGGLAAAVVAQLWETLGPDRPRIVVVEPTRADCISRSLAAGRPTAVPGDVNTFMACLAAGEVSPVAWTILGPGLDDCVAIPDEAAVAAMRLLAEGIEGDPPLVSGESGCAATAGLIAAALDPAIAAALDLGRSSRVITLGTEGATDAETYARVVGRTAEAVEVRAA
jgi:diaminopropionate ammonia-lyase